MCNIKYGGASASGTTAGDIAEFAPTASCRFGNTGPPDRNNSHPCVFYSNKGTNFALLPVLVIPIPREVIIRMKTLSKIALLVAALAFLLPLTSQNVHAQGKHPAYLHALSDLRDARAQLQRPDGGALHAEERAAIDDINKAIAEIKKAAIDDGKNIDQHDAVDAHLPWTGRLHKARDLLDKAHHDVKEEEDNPGAQGLQVRVLEHIDRAHHHVDEAIAIVEH
jgi:hypothetical protein